MSRCSVCDHSCRLVLGTGPSPASVLLIGEKPGQEEANRGKPFLGMAGKELDNTYLPKSGLKRLDVRVTNTVKCRLGDNNNTPTPKQIAACSQYWLPEEIRRTQPELIVLLGATACSLIPDVELEKDHGLPWWHEGGCGTALDSYQGWVIPMYHPAAGLHDSSSMIPLLEDFGRMGDWLHGRWEPPETLQEATDYRVLTEPTQFDGDLCYPYLPVDTEDDVGKPWSLQFSTKPGKACLIRADDKRMVEWFKECLLPQHMGLTLHFAVHDLDVLERMGINCSGLPFHDTMQEAYQLGNLPQKLKSLGWRLLGVRMLSWDDVVMPHSRRAMQEWLIEKYNDLTEHRTRVEIQLKTKLKIIYKPTDGERACKRIISHSHKPAYDLWEKSQEAGFHGYPQRSIRHVPEAEAVRYACQDADVTGRISIVLAERREEIASEGHEWYIPKRDADK